MSFVAGRNLANVKIIPFDVGGLFQNLSRGYFHPDASAEGFDLFLYIPKPLVLNTQNLRWEGAGKLTVTDANNTTLVDNECAVSVAIAPTKLPRPWDAAPVDIRLSGVDVNNVAWEAVSTAPGPDVQGTLHDNKLNVDVPLLVNHLELALGG